jgi:hypothetical protein
MSIAAHSLFMLLATLAHIGLRVRFEPEPIGLWRTLFAGPVLLIAYGLSSLYAYVVASALPPGLFLLTAVFGFGVAGDALLFRRRGSVAFLGFTVAILPTALAVLAFAILWSPPDIH